MKRIVFLTPHDAEYGFSLAGVVQNVIAEEEAEPKLRSLLSEPDTGLVVIDERLISGISDERLRELENRWYGVLLILPAPERAAVEVEDYALRLIRRAIGYHVKI